MKVTFHGCRGSVPTSSRAMSKYGGNTSCVEVRLAGRHIILDTGTGFRHVDFDRRDETLIL